MKKLNKTLLSILLVMIVLLSTETHSQNCAKNTLGEEYECTCEEWGYYGDEDFGA